MMLILRRSRLAWCLLAVLVPASAEAQWYVAGYSGAHATHAAAITITQPAQDTALRLHDITFAANPMASPQYYGIRIGRLAGARSQWGTEVEFIHLKVFAETAGSYETSGRWMGAPMEGRVRMDALVQRYGMSHGLNFLVGNLVSRRPLGGGRVASVNRIGGGITIPHGETSVNFDVQQQYETAAWVCTPRAASTLVGRPGCPCSSSTSSPPRARRSRSPAARGAARACRITPRLASSSPRTADILDSC